MFGINDSRQKIVTNGLILNYDIAQLRSYPQAGVNVNNLTGNINNGEILGDYVFDELNGGSLFFNGNDSFISCGIDISLDITAGSFDCWIKARSNADNIYRGIIVKKESWGLFVKNNILVSFDWGNSQERSTGITIGNNTWTHVAMTFSETIGTPANNAYIYVNGVQVLNTTIKYLNNFPLYIGNGNFINQLFNGNISTSSIYDRVLSSTEILQNFNANKIRYNL